MTDSVLKQTARVLQYYKYRKGFLGIVQISVTLKTYNLVQKYSILILIVDIIRQMGIP